MSKFEDYDRVSRNYDRFRYAMGIDVIAAMIQYHCGKPLQVHGKLYHYNAPVNDGKVGMILFGELHVLDAGCGTGNYSKALTESGVGQITLLDASSGMLKKAREKLEDAMTLGKVKEVVQATMPTLPFPDSSFDAVMFNLVLHHLDPNPEGHDFQQIEKTLRETRRVLKHGGVVSIMTGTPANVYENVWYIKLNKDIAARYFKRFPEEPQWHEIFQKTGFHCLSDLLINVHLPEDVLNLLLDPEGPTRKEWRDFNSYWASATEEELKELENKIADMKAQGTLDHFINQSGRATEFSVLPLYVARRL